MSILKKAGLATVMAATALTAAAPAEAQRYWHRDRRGGGDAAAGAIVGGIIGLGLGAAIASSNNRDRYYDRGYYADRGYYDNRAYYNDRYYYDAPRYRYAPPRYRYRDRGYYAQPRVIYRDYDYYGY